MELFGRLGDFWISFGWLIILGTVSMAFIGIFKRAIMKSNTLSVLQYLILWYAMTTALFGAVYIALWGFTLPQLLPGFFRTVLAGAFVNVGIQFANAKAASLDAGEVSLTAPLQAMTPGLITLLALTLGEFPSALGVTGIIIMASGSWILMFQKTPQGTYEYLGPIRELKYLWLRNATGSVQASGVRSVNSGKALVVRLALLSASLGTFGLLMDGLFTRRGITLQGLTLGALIFTAIFTASYAVWYILRPDATPEQKAKAVPYFIAYPGIILFLAASIAWILHILLVNPAYTHTYVAYVGTLKRFSILMSVVLGNIIFREQDFKKRFWASVLIIGGAILISMDELPARLSAKIELFGF